MKETCVKKLPIEVTYWKTGQRATQKTDIVYMEPGAELVATARSHLSALNADLAGFQRPFVLLAVKPFTIPDPKEPKNHDWEQTSLATLVDAAGAHHNVRCKKCGITGKHYVDALLVTRDPRYLHKRYDSCSATIRYLSNAANRIKERDNVREGV